MRKMVCIKLASWTTWECDIESGPRPGARQSARAALRQLRKRKRAESGNEGASRRSGGWCTLW